MHVCPMFTGPVPHVGGPVLPPGAAQARWLASRAMGKPRTPKGRAVVVNLIGNTTTRTGLEIQAELDTNSYQTGIKVTDEELAAVRITREEFHGEWNYTISPRR